MPTQHVEPQAKERLGDVANALLKARKVVVVTGAGISTNSGIPDFRSENGLYSLIQAQFDAASRQARQNDLSDNEEGLDGTAVAPRPVKRRKMSVDSLEDDVKDSITVKMETNNNNTRDMIEVQPVSPPLCTASEGAGKDTASTMTTTATATAASITITTTQMVVETGFSTPKSKVATMSAAEPTTSPLSSPPGEDFIIPPSAFRYRTRKRLTDASLPLSSSPLSSPPPVLFDPFIPSSPSEASSSSRRSSTSPPSEVDEDNEDPSASQYSSSQSSSGGRNTLPNMKGKDLFDANIWSDPVRTSVFYTFATSLRQKIRSAEPTTSHRFISHLRDRGKLVRCYTQNIDQIEEKVGLSTRLQDGPGSRGRFSRRSTAGMNQLSKMVEEADPCSNEQQPVPENSNQSDTSTDSSQQSRDMGADASDAPGADELLLPSDESKSIPRALKKQLPRSGVECVFLHGSLQLLRCFLCGRVCSWDEHDRETETLSGQQPECPHCVGATAAREERGKRALGVGKLRPDIVLYGEEHPSSHLISPIITHDLGLYPDMLLILGTSLRVHGLKVMVREFAKAVHSKGGKVIFVNFTKPPESIWGDIIDYWVQWDCDAWVDDLQLRIPKLWQEPELPRPRKKRESSGTSEESTKEEEEEKEEKEEKKEKKEKEKEKKEKEEKEKKKEKKEKKEKKKKPPAANPAALRDTKVTGAYWTCKVLDELHRITGRPGAKAGSSKHTSAAAILCAPSTPTVALAAPAAPAPPAAKSGPEMPDPMAPQQATRAKQKRSRKSAPGALERAQRPSSTLNPNHGRWRKKMADPPTTQKTPAAPVPMSTSSILSSVKENPRIRKRKMIDGEEVPAPSAGKRRNKHEPKLPPMRLSMTNLPPSLHGKPWAMEPESSSPPSGPLSSLSPNVRSAKVLGKPHTSFHHHDPMVCLLKEAPEWACTMQSGENRPPAHRHDMRDEASAAMTLAGLRSSPVLMTRSVPPHKHGQGNLEGELISWASSWGFNM